MTVNSETDSVLFGLTPSETTEFKELGKPARGSDEFEARLRDARWIELFLKHERAKVGQLQ